MGCANHSSIHAASNAMHISPSTSQPLPSLLPDSMAAPGRQESLGNSGSAAKSGSISPASPHESKNPADGERVTLTAAAGPKPDVPDLAPVYAEIWKNGTKVAEIDIHGGVNPINGLVAAAPGSVGGGALLAARRTAEIVRSIGGEIRFGGQIMDSQTLDMRARLKVVYGI